MQVAALHVVPPFVDTSMPDTAALSVAVPLIVNGLAEALLMTAPFAGVVMVHTGMPTSPVVYENE